MNLFAFSGFLLGSTCLLLSVLLIRHGTTRVHLTFALQNLAISVWGFGCGFAGISTQHDQVLFWWGFAHVGAFFVVVFLLHHILLINKMKQLFLLTLLYILAIALPILFFSGLIDIKLKYVFNSFFIPEGQGPLYPFYCISWILIAAYTTILLIRAFVMAEKSEKKTMMLYSFAYIFGLWGGATYVFLALGVNIYPYGNFLIPVYCAIITYSILRHKLFDIEVIIKKTLVFASLFTIVFSVFVGVTLFIQRFIGTGAHLLGLAVSSIIIILSVRPLEEFLTKVTDKYLFQKKYDYKQILKSFIDEVITVLSLDSVVQSTLELLDKTLHPERAAILLLSRYEDKYVSYRVMGYDGEIALDNISKIPILLKAAKDIISIEGRDNSIKAAEELKDEMKALNARLAIPLMLHNDLIGIMLLGRKKSDEEYSKDDMEILSDLARTEAVAIGNAQLFADTAQNERRAAIGTLAAGINHEIGNPLNIINTKMQVYLMSIDKGLYKDKRQEDVINEARDIMGVCLQQTTRISDITRKLSSFAKPSKDFRPELTDIEEQLDDTLAVVGHDLELERIEIKKNIQKSLPGILSDKRQVQQIFFNIIKNAGQAIKENGSIEIKAYNSNDGNVKIEITDTGCGIPDDKIDKIYEPFYTTKEPGKGTGLGLAIVRQLVWRNKGDIKVKSAVGKGTTFVITFPAAK